MTPNAANFPRMRVRTGAAKERKSLDVTLYFALSSEGASCNNLFFAGLYIAAVPAHYIFLEKMTINNKSYLCDSGSNSGPKSPPFEYNHKHTIPEHIHNSSH